MDNPEIQTALSKKHRAKTSKDKNTIQKLKKDKQHEPQQNLV
jgi:hypothetical protein